ncbi:MAG: hypothetical protein ACQKBV_14210 [Puniceicoccales bacterium]
MIRLLLLALLCFAPLAHGEGYRIYQIEITKQKLDELGFGWMDPQTGSGMSDKPKAVKELLAVIGQDGVTLRAFADLEKIDENLWQLDETHLVHYPAKVSETGEILETEERRVGVFASVEKEDEHNQIACIKATFRHVRLNSWVPFPNAPSHYNPIFSTNETISDICIQHAVVIGGLTRENSQTLIVIERTTADQ